MIHPMLMHAAPATERWINVREMSCNFQGHAWEQYNLYMHVHHLDD